MGGVTVVLATTMDDAAEWRGWLVIGGYGAVAVGLFVWHALFDTTRHDD